MNRRIGNLSARAEFFLIVTLSFAYFIGTSIAVLVLRVRELEITAGLARDEGRPKPRRSGP